MASCEELPAVQIFESREYAEVDWGKLLMEFRLIYQGPLLAASDKDARLAHKHEIRKKIHAQLAELWQAHPFLNELSRTWPDHSSGKEARRSKLDGLADQNIVNGIRFAPLVSQYYGLICSLDILFLRRGAEGNLIQ